MRLVDAARLRRALPRASVRLLCTDERVSVQGAFGSRGSRGSGKSLMGSKSRGIRKEDMEALAQGLHQADDELEAGDVLMEVLAEDHRRNRTVDFLVSSLEDDESGGRPPEDPKPLLGSKKRVAHRRYLTHSDVGPGTIFQRQAATQQRRLEGAVKYAFEYKQPEEVKQQREHDRQSRARQRDHDVIENRIQEAFVNGAFDNLKGAGQPLKRNDNIFEEISGEAVRNIGGGLPTLRYVVPPAVILLQLALMFLHRWRTES